MSDRHLGALKASDTDHMPTTGAQWLTGDVPGGGEFRLEISNTDPTMTLTVKVPGMPDVIETLDFYPTINRWVHSIVRDVAIQN